MTLSTQDIKRSNDYISTIGLVDIYLFYEIDKWADYIYTE